MKQFHKTLMSVLAVVIVATTLPLSIFGQHSYNESILLIGEKYSLKINSQIKSVFEIEIPQDGNLTLSFQTFSEETFVALYDKNGHFLQPASNKITTGNNSYSPWSNEDLHLCWDQTVEKFIGSFTYKLDKGQYHIRVSRSATGLSRVDLSIELKDLNGNFVYVNKNVPKGNEGNNNNNSVLPKPVITDIWIQEDGVHIEGTYSNGTTDVTAIHTNTAKGESFNDGQVWVDGKGNFAGYISEDKIQKGVDYNIVVEAKNRSNGQTANSDVKTVNMLPKPVVTKIETKNDGIHFEGTYSNGTTDVTAIHTNTAREESFSDGQVWVDGKGNFNGFISEDKIEKSIDYKIVIVAQNRYDGRTAISETKTINIPLPNNSSNNTIITNNIKAVYIMNESTAVLWGLGHNFIAFEYENGGGVVYSYGPYNSGAGGAICGGTFGVPARMWVKSFGKDDFQKGLKTGIFSLSARTIKSKPFYPGTGICLNYQYDKNNEYCYGNATQKFDRYLKIDVNAENGKKMITAAAIYLRNHPAYGVFNPSKGIGQCDNMTSEIAGAGGKGYSVKSTPNWSFESITGTCQYTEQWKK